MVDKPHRKSPEHDSDYDGAWKETLRRHLPALLAKYFPSMHAAIDWSVEPQWFDKELSQVLGQAGKRNQQVDVLVKLRLLSGQDQWFLLHLEIQTAYEENFESRIGLYNCGLYWIFKHRVATLVILGDLRSGWQPQEDVFGIADFETRIRFPVCKLIDKLNTEWKDDHSLPVLIARAQIEALRTTGDPGARYEAKWRLVRKLYDLGYNADEVRELVRLIDWMMHLRKDLSERFEHELTELEEELHMPYITSMEQIAEARGEARATADVIVRVLRHQCGTLPEEIQGRIIHLPLETLEVLKEEMFRFRDLIEVQEWLDAQREPSE